MSLGDCRTIVHRLQHHYHIMVLVLPKRSFLRRKRRTTMKTLQYTLSLLITLVVVLTFSLVEAFIDPHVSSRSTSTSSSMTMSSSSSDPTTPSAAATPRHPFCDLPGDPSLILTTNVDLGAKKLDIMKGKKSHTSSTIMMSHSMVVSDVSTSCFYMYIFSTQEFPNPLPNTRANPKPMLPSVSRIRLA